MSQRLINWFKFASPASFYPLAGKAVAVVRRAGRGLRAAGLWLGFFVAPTDFQQGEGYRIDLHPRAGLVDVHVHLLRDGLLGGHRASPSTPACRG